MRDDGGPAFVEAGRRQSAFFAPISSLIVLYNNRFLISNLIRRDVRGKYRSSFLGYLWTILEPALLSAVYYFLFIMLADNPDKFYAVWVIIGVIVWSCFSKCLQGTVTSLTRNTSTIHLVYFPRMIFSFASFGSTLWISVMSSFVLIPLIIFYDITLSWTLILVPLAIVIAAFNAIGLGLLLAPINCIHRDVEHLIRFVVRAGFFLSPVMWTWDMAVNKGWAADMVIWNPMVYPITLAREAFLGQIPDYPMYGIAISLSWGVLMWIIGSIIFNRYEQQAVKYL